MKKAAIFVLTLAFAISLTAGQAPAQQPKILKISKEPISMENSSRFRVRTRSPSTPSGIRIPVTLVI